MSRQIRQILAGLRKNRMLASCLMSMSRQLTIGEQFTKLTELRAELMSFSGVMTAFLSWSWSPSSVP